MQRDTWKPGAIIETDTRRRWWLRLDDDGVKRYHVNPYDRGRLPSSFFSESGKLRTGYRAA